jgi:hypothetical protein
MRSDILDPCRWRGHRELFRLANGKSLLIGELINPWSNTFRASVLGAANKPARQRWRALANG